MQRSITYRGIEYRDTHSQPVLENFANQHLDKVAKFLENQRTPVVIDLILEASHVHAHHKVTLVVKTPEYDLVAQHEGPELYQEIDRVTDKMIQEIRKAKDRLVTKHQEGPSIAGEIRREIAREAAKEEEKEEEES